MQRSLVNCGQSSECQSVVRRVAAEKCGGLARRRQGGSQAEAECEATPAPGKCLAAGCSGSRFRYGFVDPATGGDGDRAIDERAQSPRSCVENSGSHGLDPATTGQAGQGARPGESTLEADREMAGGKKNARRGKAWILFQDESGVSQRPSVRRTWAPKGETPS